MTRSILLMSPVKDTCELLQSACEQLPVEIIHAKECHEGIVAARSCEPSIIFIDATDLLSHNGWVMARLIKMDEQLSAVPVMVLSDDRNAPQLAQKSFVDNQLPRFFPVTDVRTLIQQNLNRVSA